MNAENEPTAQAEPKRVLITGAARAIGWATAAELANRGHDVIATARNVDAIPAHAGVRPLALDVTSDESVAACLAQAGELDVVINNAAISGGGPLESFPIDAFRDVLETNTVGALRMVQAVLPAWRERGSGRLVNVSSVQGAVGSPLEGPYCASKWALEAMSESLHYELGHFGIRVVIVQPGYIAPGMKANDEHPGSPAYDGLREQWTGNDETLTGGARTTSEEAARRIADAVEDPEPPLRVRIGEDAELVLGTRAKLSDAEFEAAMRATLGLTW